jgi:hypothetical protein
MRHENIMRYKNMIFKVLHAFSNQYYFYIFLKIYIYIY